MRLYLRLRLLMVVLASVGLIIVFGLCAGGGRARAASSSLSTSGTATPVAEPSPTSTTPDSARTAMGQACTPAMPSAMETLIVPFTRGTTGVSTTRCYRGTVVVRVSGIGQAAGTAYSDAFYVFTNKSGQPIPPIHYAPPDYYYTWELWINGGPSDSYVQPIPTYHRDHVYTFDMTVPGGPLNFAVGDIDTGDNTGAYIVTICLR